MRPSPTVVAVLLLAASLALGAEPEEHCRAALRTHEGRMELLRDQIAGYTPWLPVLFDITAGEDRGVAAEAGRVIRWIATRANTRPERREDTVETLLETAREHPDAGARRLAVAALALCGRDEALEPLAAFLDAPALAPAAAESLAQLPSPKATQVLADAYAKARGESRGVLGRALAARRDPAAVPLVRKMLADEALREAALRSLRLTEAAAAAEALADAVPQAEPAFRVRLIEALGERRHRPALPVLVNQAQGGEPPVRAAALEALGRLGDASSIPLVREATQDEEEAVRAAAIRAAIRLADQLEHATRYSQWRPDPHPRDAAEAWERVMKRLELRDEAVELAMHALRHATRNADRIAALGVLQRAERYSGRIVTHGRPSAAHRRAMPAILPFITRGSPRVRLTAVRALDANPSFKATEAMARLLKDADPAVRVALLEALGHRGQPATIPAILAVVKGPHEPVRVAALDALAGIGYPAAKPAALEALENGTKAVRAAAARACLAIARRDLELFHRDLPDHGKRALPLLHRVLEADADREATLGALEGVADVAARESAPLAQKHLGGPRPVREAAARACLAIGTRLAAEGKTKEAEALFTKVWKLGDKVEASTEAATKLRAIGSRVELPARNGVVRPWWILGAWPATQAEWARPLPPEREVNLRKACKVGDRSLAWKPIHTDEPSGAVMLDDLLRPNDQAVAYAFTEIQVTREQDVVLEVASDDGCIVWLNGAKVYEHLAPRGWGSPADSAKAHLAAGRNRLLLKACEGGGTWAFRVRLLDAAGKPLDFTMR